MQYDSEILLTEKKKNKEKNNFNVIFSPEICIHVMQLVMRVL